MGQPQTTPDPVPHVGLSAFLERKVVFLRGYGCFNDAEDVRVALYLEGLDARVVLGVGCEHLFVVFVPVGEARRALKALRAAHRPDRSPKTREREARPTMPGAPGLGEDGGAPAKTPPPLRRVKPAGTHWEALRRLLCARCKQLEKMTGELADETRHEAARAASATREHGPVVSSSRALTDEEMSYAVSVVEDRLHAEDFDFELDQEAYERRCRMRAAMDAARAARPNQAA